MGVVLMFAQMKGPHQDRCQGQRSSPMMGLWLKWKKYPEYGAGIFTYIKKKTKTKTKTGPVL